LPISRPVRYRPGLVSLNEMASEGYLVRVKGKGTFVRIHQTNGKNQKLTVFALVLPEVRDGFYPSLIKSFGDAAGELNHQILTCNTDNDAGNQGNAILQLIDNGVAGVAIVPTTKGTPPVHHVRQLQSNGIPVVLLHRGVHGVSAPLLVLELEKAGRMAATAFLSAGHRRVAFFGTHKAAASDAVAEGIRSVLRNVGSDLPESLIHYGCRMNAYVPPDHETGIEQALRRMLALLPEQRPTAIYCTWDTDGELIYMSLAKLGVRVPQDVSLISFGGAWRNNVITRRLTAVTVLEDDAGRHAASLLDEMCDGRRPINDEFRSAIPLRLYEGETLFHIS
jgi:GntR family transcriptional regulator, arabinose operon transcriptional repressor